MNSEDKKGEANGVMIDVNVTKTNYVYKFSLLSLCPSSSLSISILS
jgi:hypothetical protein